MADEDHRAAPEWPVLDVDLAERTRLRRRLITPEFFNRNIGNSLDGARVERVRFRRARLLGFSGSRMRQCELTLSDGRVLAVILKVALRGLPQEALFYCDLAPYVPIRIPRTYGLAPNPEPGGQDVLIIEALPPPLPVAQFNAGHLKQVAAAVAKLHAAFMESEALATTGWLPDAMRVDREIFKHRIKSALHAIRSREERLRYFPVTLGSEGERIVTQAAEDIGRFLEPLERLPSTLIHGDLNPNNLMIPQAAADGGERAEIALVDWQTVARGPGILDIVNLHRMSRFHGLDRWRRGTFGEPLAEWNDLAGGYLDALEHETGLPCDREAFMAAAPAADAILTLRFWIPLFGLALEAGPIDFFCGRMGWLFRPLLRWARVEEQAQELVGRPVKRLTRIDQVRREE